MTFEEIKTQLLEVGEKTSVMPKELTSLIIDLINLVEMVNVLTSASVLNMGKTGNYTFEGATSVWKLPEFNSSFGRRYIIMNEGTGTIEIDTFDGADDIFAGGSKLAMITVGVGEIAVLLNNGVSWFRQL